MFKIRPIRQDDLKGLMELLEDSGHGLTSLPKDEDVITKKIKHSVRSFESDTDRPAGELYLFILEEIFTGNIAGVSGIISKIGGFEPYYFYRIKEEEFNSPMLNVNKKIQSLHFEATHSGPAEICSLFLSPKFRNAQNGRFLSLSRFLYIANFKERFEKNIIAEMRGQVNEDGNSPFWDAVGKNFFDIEFVKADYLTMKSKKFIDDLLPKYPIIVELLPKEAREVVGEVHPNTIPARKILEKEGFSFQGRVGIFEPGPVLEANVDNIRAIKESKVVTVKNVSESKIAENIVVISNTAPNFLATVGGITFESDTEVTIDAVTASSLKVKLGESIRFVSLRAS